MPESREKIVERWTAAAGQHLHRLLCAGPQEVAQVLLAPAGDRVFVYSSNANRSAWRLKAYAPHAEEPLLWDVSASSRLNDLWLLPTGDILTPFQSSRIRVRDGRTGEVKGDFLWADKGAPNVFLDLGDAWFFAGPQGRVALVNTHGEILAAGNIARANKRPLSFQLGAISPDRSTIALATTRPELFVLDARTLELTRHIRAPRPSSAVQFNDEHAHYYEVSFDEAQPHLVEVRGRTLTLRFDLGQGVELSAERHQPRTPISRRPHFEADPATGFVYVALTSSSPRTPVAVVRPPYSERHPSPRVLLSQDGLSLVAIGASGAVAFASATESLEHPFQRAYDRRTTEINPPPPRVPKANPYHRPADPRPRVLWPLAEAEEKASAYREPILVAVRATSRGDLRLYCLAPNVYEVRSAFADTERMDKSRAARWLAGADA